MHTATLVPITAPILATKVRVRVAFESVAKPFREAELIAKAMTR